MLFCVWKIVIGVVCPLWVTGKLCKYDKRIPVVMLLDLQMLLHRQNMFCLNVSACSGKCTSTIKEVLLYVNLFHFPFAFLKGNYLQGFIILQFCQKSLFVLSLL